MLTVAGLFAGVGGFETGFEQAGLSTALFCEIDAPASAVLKRHWPDVPLIGDVRDITCLPDVDVITAGFPCQDLSQAGRTAGIGGSRSSLVGEVFRPIGGRRCPDWLVLENVPFMLRLDRGQAMKYLTDELADRGLRWAYRVVDTLNFGLPQRRRRVILVASMVHDPCTVLFADNAPPTAGGDHQPESTSLCGFYWTEGTRGLGWAVDAVPTVKGGSSVGIPSPPAIWDRLDGSISTPDIRDIERLQGFPAGWTADCEIDISDRPPRARRNGPRWRLVGNAVSVPVARWIGSRLLKPGASQCATEPLPGGAKWPDAAWGGASGIWRCDASDRPIIEPRSSLRYFFEYPREPLSHRATSGFLRRAQNSTLKFEPGFLDDVDAHLDRLENPLAAV